MSGAAAGAGLRRVLLIEPDNLIRGTVASVCRDLSLVQVIQAVSVAQGEQALQSHSVQGMVLSLSDEVAALSLLTRLRADELGCTMDLAVAVLAHGCTPELAAQLKSLEVRRLLLQPFKLRDVIHTLENLWPETVPVAA
ncbi:histidine kinase [Hydrogenophaga sp.]|uniref:histidine kinase n=1 Tax=Hydrogenophaga sp. TaxID=1904254 RepID=UPI0025B86A79|nr:histidine kinase [Hydrogenophaga sp.]